MEFFTPYKPINDVIPILPSTVGWVAAATLVVMFPKNSSLSTLMLGGAKMWLIGFHILVLIMLYGLVTSTLWGFFIINLQSFQTMVNK